MEILKEKILYHGSQHIIDRPEYGKGRLYNDYGRGFYCTEHLELAKEWAVGENIDGYVNRYEIKLNDLKVLDLSDSKYNILNWLALLLKNRQFNTKSPIAISGKEYILEKFLIDTSEYDLIVGYRADDSYFAFARDFLNNTISIQQLKYAMELGKLKLQHVLISEKAFKKIKLIDYKLVDSSIYFVKRKNRDEKARLLYFEELKKTVNDGIYLRDVINGVSINE